MEDCEKFYRKAVEVNPRFLKAWNNLGNIYQNKEDYEQASEFYQHAIEYNSTYTLAFANLGVCLLKLQKYKDAFKYFSQAKEALPNDNGLNPGNRTFLS
jgi:tetratricopeptide (TPR) repeat protein